MRCKSCSVLPSSSAVRAANRDFATRASSHAASRQAFTTKVARRSNSTVPLPPSLEPTRWSRFLQSLDWKTYMNYYTKEQRIIFQVESSKKERKGENQEQPEAESGWTQFWGRALERMNAPERRSGYLWAVLILAALEVLLNGWDDASDDRELRRALHEDKGDVAVVACLLEYIKSAKARDVGVTGEVEKKKSFHILAQNSEALEVLFRGIVSDTVTPAHFANCVKILSDLMEDELSKKIICSNMNFQGIFAGKKGPILNALNDEQRFLLFYLLQACSTDATALSRMAEANIAKPLMSSFQRYQLKELYKMNAPSSEATTDTTIMVSSVGEGMSPYTVHIASQVAMLLALVNLTTADGVRETVKSNQEFMRVLHVVSSMHRDRSLKATAEAAYLNITKDAHITAPTSIETTTQSIHKYTRENTLAFYGTGLAFGFTSGLVSGLMGFRRYGGLRGAALVKKSLGYAMTTPAGTFLMAGFIRDAMSVASSAEVRALHESKPVLHAAFNGLTVGYLGIGAFVLNAAFPHAFAAAVTTNICFPLVLKTKRALEQYQQQPSKVDAQKKMAD